MAVSSPGLRRKPAKYRKTRTNYEQQLSRQEVIRLFVIGRRVFLDSETYSDCNRPVPITAGERRVCRTNAPDFTYAAKKKTFRQNEPYPNGGRVRPTRISRWNLYGAGEISIIDFGRFLRRRLIRFVKGHA